MVRNIATLLLVVVSISSAVGGQQVAPQSTTPSSQAPLTLTLQDALALARKNNVEFNAALTDQGLAHQDKVQARAALLPSVVYNNQALYTQGNGTHSNTPIFIANNNVHEYISQGNGHESLGVGDRATYGRAGALEAVARARQRSPRAAWWSRWCRRTTD